MLEGNIQPDFLGDGRARAGAFKIKRSKTKRYPSKSFSALYS